MKKVVISVVILFALSCTFAVADSGHPYFNDLSYHNEYRGNISPENLPQTIKDYLGKHYTGHTVLVSRLQDDGRYFVKIRYAGNRHRPYYRSLVFDHNGNPIKG